MLGKIKHIKHEGKLIMDISIVYGFLTKEAENIKNLAIYLPILWGVLFTKDWLSITSFYSFYGINRLCKLELKQLLNLRYVASLFISVFLFVGFNLMIAVEPFILGIALLIVLFVFGVVLKSAVNYEKEYDASKELAAADCYRIVRENLVFISRWTIYTSILSILLLLYSFAVYGFFDWQYTSELIYTLFYFCPLVIICFITDIELKRMATSSSQTNYLIYSIISFFQRNKFPQSYFYKLNKFVNIVNINDSTYVVVFPLDNEEREGVIAIKTVLCRKDNKMIYAYISPSEIVYDLDLSDLKQEYFFVDRITRLTIDTYAIVHDSSLSDLCNANSLNNVFIADKIVEFWNGKSWESIDSSTSIKKTKKVKKTK